MSETKKPFSALDMAQSYAKENDMENIDDIFKKPTKEETPKKENKPHKPGQWRPDEKLLEGLGDVNGKPVTYAKDEIHYEGENDVKVNINDDQGKKYGKETHDRLTTAAERIEAAKERAGIKYLQIPNNHALFARFMDCAEDNNVERSARALDELLVIVKNEYPDFILNPAEVEPQQLSEPVAEESIDEELIEEEEIDEEENNNIIQINVDKEAADKVIIQNPEDYDVIKRKREVRLNIVEGANLEFSEIEETLDNEVDKVLSELYVKKTNDIEGALPASKYRATFTGLSYPEVIDLSYSTEINSFDAEKKKWSIAYRHITNPSIGPWEEYRWYIDPVTHQKVKVTTNEDISEDINPDGIHYVSKFEDFLMKTSFLDIEFILWKILCATTMDKEIIHIECKNRVNGKLCGTSHNWIYRPVELLDMNSINSSILEDIEKTMSCNSVEDVLNHYKSSLVSSNNVATLPTSGFKVIFGHASAYDYLYGIYGAIEDLSNTEDKTEGLSKSIKVTITQAIKGFLIPTKSGKYKKISSTEGILKVLDKLDDLDFQSLNQIVKLVITPYNSIKFRIPDVKCPTCGSKDDIAIKDMNNLLFIITQSLEETQVTLNHN